MGFFKEVLAAKFSEIQFLPEYYFLRVNASYYQAISQTFLATRISFKIRTLQWKNDVSFEPPLPATGALLS